MKKKGPKKQNKKKNIWKTRSRITKPPKIISHVRICYEEKTPCSYSGSAMFPIGYNAVENVLTTEKSTRTRRMKKDRRFSRPINKIPVKWKAPA